jgi:hypothetical protein
VNQPVRKTVAISNSCQAPLMVRGLTCTGEFSLLTAAPITIAPGSSGNIVVEFKPVTTGSKQGQLSVSDDAPGSPRSVDLTGAGI